MSMIDDIKRDRDAGGDDMPTSILDVPFKIVAINVGRKSIDRILAMESALLAADELAKAVDDMHEDTGLTTLSVSTALAAYREATQ